MFPSNSAYNISYALRTHIIFFSQYIGRKSILPLRSYFQYFIIIQFTHTVDSAVRWGGMSFSTFLLHIRYILLLGPPPQMSRVATTRIITSMHTNLVNILFTRGQEKSYAITKKDILFAVAKYSEFTIFMFINKCQPRPTFIHPSLLNIRPKSRFVRFSKCWNYFTSQIRPLNCLIDAPISYLLTKFHLSRSWYFTTLIVFREQTGSEIISGFTTLTNCQS